MILHALTHLAAAVVGFVVGLIAAARVYRRQMQDDPKWVAAALVRSVGSERAKRMIKTTAPLGAN
jgi:uncharacterized membrane protein YoaK (UPF0700 family)